MTTDTQTFQIENEQLDLLEKLLEDPIFQDDALRLDEIQGFLCAVLSGPSPMQEEDWLIEILGTEEALNTEQGQQAAHILRRFALALRTGLDAGALPELLLYPKDESDDDNAPRDYLPWCQAYLFGVDASEKDWFESLGDGNGGKESSETEFLDERLFTFMVLSGEAKSAALEHGETWPKGNELDELESQCQEDLPQVVVDIYAFWKKT